MTDDLRHGECRFHSTDKRDLNLETVAWRTPNVLAIARQLSPAARRLSASACWCSLSLSVRPFVDARNSRGQRNPRTPLH
jgi:hypothetical protein